VNARSGLYYEPPSRLKRNYRFIGLHEGKTVQYIGTVEAIAVASYGGGAFGGVDAPLYVRPSSMSPLVRGPVSAGAVSGSLDVDPLSVATVSASICSCANA
jgi:hypothetical protein